MSRWATLSLTMLVLAGPAFGADLDGTLKKIKSTNTITLGYREASQPFSFTDSGKPAGYSVDLCARVAASVGKELGLSALEVKWVKVTVEDSVQAAANGVIDLECGPTTASLSRQEMVDFSLMTFLDGGSLLVTNASRIRGVSTLSGKRVAIVPGTTTETRLTEVLKKRAVSATMVPVKDHDAGVAALDYGTADAYASDRVILVGIGRTSTSPDKLSLVDELFSYEPYGLMLRRGDPDFRLAVNRVLARLYRSGQIAEVYVRWFGAFGVPSPLLAAMYAIEGLPE